MSPVRIQRLRVKGWKIPPNTVSVTRPGRYGNPFKVGPDGTAQECVDKFRAAVPDFAKQAYRDELRGKNLACFCALDRPCHADVLLELANGPALPQADRHADRESAVAEPYRGSHDVFQKPSD